MVVSGELARRKGAGSWCLERGAEGAEGGHVCVCRWCRYVVCGSVFSYGYVIALCKISEEWQKIHCLRFREVVE